MDKRKAGLFLGICALLMAFGSMLLSAKIQGSLDVDVQQVHFSGAKGAQMRALLFRPAGATALHKAPAILAVHGYLNNAEIQANFATEFARRGYVVLAPDQRGHGGSDPTSFADGFGGPDALAYLRSLPFVDRDNIGLEGHSMGGWAVLAAAKAYPNGYKSLVLEGSSVGAPFAPAGTRTFPRNLLVVFGTRDEFGGLMWGAEAPLRTGATEKARTTFGTGTAPVVAGQLYGRIEEGTARKLLTPSVSHAWLHQSATGITPAIDWFGQTLRGGRTIPADRQVWYWREAGNLLALIMIPLSIAGFLAAAGVAFARVRPLANDGIPTTTSGRDIALLAVVPALLYIPACMAVEAMLGQNSLFRQTFSNQYAGWAFLCSLLSLAVLRRRHALVWTDGVARALGMALLALIPAYLLIFAMGRLFHVNPSWWIVTIRPLTMDRARDFLVYAPFFILSCATSLRLLDDIRPLMKGSLVSALGEAALALSGGFVLFLAAQYGTLAATGQLLLPQQGLLVIPAINFAVLLLFVAILGVFSQRFTGSTLPGGIAAGLFLTWTLTATQPIGV
ncbi:pimeloyl-ACP methyl ester carboxylesterase [Sphingobium xenophagum]|uniref:Pimeloyl-ACP methyl ester carboxylesterase n=1 Tax=Sphingobium xenophagum TaxID=121428 RepID=A0ABU1X6P8_SPHXE|nr:alpha/beta fold hydrolase [Sphingobium xenophagum]MDR7157228.1 pimeloyl-ACP methyl ester carboxylesterase [Sphingobium xenophagum]